MKYHESLPLKGVFTASLIDPKTGLVTARKSATNVVTRRGQNLVARLLAENVGYDTGLTYQAIGTGTTTPSVTDTVLDTETARRSITTRGETTTRIAAFFTFFPFPDVGAQIDEVGVFGHSTASATADSGVLFSRATLSLTNTDDNNLVVSYVLTIG